MSEMRPESPSAIALPHFCLYLTRIPPGDYDSILSLCRWSLDYVNAKGVTPFCTERLTDEVQQILIRDFPFRVQHIIVNALCREAWARCWCKHMGVSIANETPLLSRMRYQQVSPVNLAQQHDRYQQLMRRTEALKKMQQRKAQQENP